jgi:hypothetical protein
MVYDNPLRTRKVNIRIEYKPNFMNIGDYWIDESVGKIVELLCEYHNLFLNTLS